MKNSIFFLTRNSIFPLSCCKNNFRYTKKKDTKKNINDNINDIFFFFRSLKHIFYS